MDDTERRELRRELTRQGIGLVALGIAAVLVDPVQRREVALAWRRCTADVRRVFTDPPPRRPQVWEIAALQDEARRITREATREDG